MKGLRSNAFAVNGEAKYGPASVKETCLDDRMTSAGCHTATFTVTAALGPFDVHVPKDLI